MFFLVDTRAYDGPHDCLNYGSFSIDFLVCNRYFYTVFARCHHTCGNNCHFCVVGCCSSFYDLNQGLCARLHHLLLSLPHRDGLPFYHESHYPQIGRLQTNSIAFVYTIFVHFRDRHDYPIYSHDHVLCLLFPFLSELYSLLILCFLSYLVNLCHQVL